MSTHPAFQRAIDQSRRLRVDKPGKFRLEKIDPAGTGSFKSREDADGLLEQGVATLRAQQEMLYAQDKWAVLLIFQAMDAAGKDGTIEHVMTGVNPQGCQVFSFKAPSAEELDHDFLWRASRSLPERGRIGIFNRSYYEETVVVRVHPEFLAKQRLPEQFTGKKIWRHRFEDINAFERYLSRNGVLIRKFFLHVSKAEQKERFLARLDEPEKNWKFSAADVRERAHWPEYMAAFQEAIQSTSTGHAPWYVIPADNKWFTRLMVSAAIVDALESLSLSFPTISAAEKKELAEARAILLAEEKPASGKKRKAR